MPNAFLPLPLISISFTVTIELFVAYRPDEIFVVSPAFDLAFALLTINLLPLAKMLMACPLFVVLNEPEFTSAFVFYKYNELGASLLLFAFTFTSLFSTVKF